MTTPLSRRDFLAGSGALIVGFSMTPMLEPGASAQGPFDTHPSHIDPEKLDSWIAVGDDGVITARTGKCDFGQGMYTAQTQLIAEELCVPLDQVVLIQCDTSITPDQGTTSGSRSTPTNFNTSGLAQAAATAREALINLAAQQLGISASQLTATGGFVTAADGHRVSYRNLVSGKKFHLVVDPKAKRRSPEDWTVLGKPVPSLDLKDLVTARFEFVHNVHVPGMLHGRMVRPPEVGATLVRVNESSIRGMPGLVRVVVRKDLIGVIAEKQIQAIHAAAKLKVIWGSGRGLPDQKNFYDHIRKQPSHDTLIVDSQDVDQRLSGAATVLKASYAHPYQAHGSVGASCAVADVRGEKATLWSATQSAYPTRQIVATVLKLRIDDVRVIYVRGSGCYGLNGADSVSLDAALLSQAVQRPVRVQFSREDEMAWGENYGAACVIEQRAALDASGEIVAWECEPWSVSLGGRPGYDTPGNVITGALAGYEPHTVKAQKALPPSGKLRNGGNAVPSYLAGCIGGTCYGTGAIRRERVLTHTVSSPFFTGPLRSPLRLQNTFAHECFIDELAAHAQADPAAYRLRHLREPRLADVVKAAAQAAQWDTRPSPKTSWDRHTIARGRGIACVAYEGDNGYVAAVVEVEVDPSSGRVRPKRFVVAQDCGPISNPAGMRNQIEGGILQGMSRCLGEEITWDARKITSIDWNSYHSLDLGIELPSIECVLMNRRSVPATGAGETAITVVAAVIGNAIFDATGIRLRQVPFTEERVKAAISGNTV
ncbi:MAG TPA: molybdopterin cofactor-binding domain-containing protein [Candidatus Sulfotelmatobacter sp.]|nr:molybdopterin cofactor-binding domain-containing protein [Candidatus Sulfotelmatobacter sp.]